MKRMSGDSRNRFWLTLGLVAVITIMASGPILAAGLTQDEIDDLVYMREEEKLARDVYIALYEEWGLTIFSNISKSEQTHMDAIKTLLDRYGRPDPVQGVGVFTNGDLQELYNELIDKGFLSVTDALEVGVIIEETDIADLEAALARTTHKDIIRVYTNLKAGSLNHLQAFNSQLEND